jgi:hypothetical protein
LSEGVDGEMDPGAPEPLGPVTSSLQSAFRRALQGAAFEDCGAGLGSATLADLDQYAQIGDDGLEDLRIDLATICW